MENMKPDADVSRRIGEVIGQARRIGIVGHIHPDGDDVGSCLGICRYAQKLNPAAEIRVFLERFPRELLFLPGANDVIHDFSKDWDCDLCFAMDCADLARLGEAVRYFNGAAHTICLDHHITNTGYGEISVVLPEASSTCEVVCQVIDMDRLDPECAECLYLGIVHDTGVFKYSNTSEQTMQIAGALITKGARPEYVIDTTFYSKTYAQNRALGQVLLNARLLLDGRFIYGSLRLAEMERLSVTPADLDGIIAQLRVTKGTQVSALIYEQREGLFKVSLRSNSGVDVSRIAVKFHGGGHVKAAGCEIAGDPEEIAATLAELIGEQLS